MLKALTFIGLGNYDETTYVKHDDPCKTCKTDLFPKAVAELYEPDKIIAFVTPKVKSAKAKVIEGLEEDISNFCTQEIQNGNSPEELWEIFDVCAKTVELKDEIILDITHAFRSIPLLVFIVSAYLRQVKDVELKHIIYGAYEARDTSKNETPIFDLTPFVDLLNWTNAVNVFQHSGDARQLAGLGGVSTIRRELTTLSDALLTNRTLEAQEAVPRLIRRLERPETLDRLEAPFHILVDQVKDTYAGISVGDPALSPRESLTGQYVQIKWYIDNLHYLHAITLIREWLVSWELLQIHRTSPNLLDLPQRAEAEHALNTRFAAKSKLPLDKLWSACNGTRNDLAHCGMRPDARSSNTAIAAIKKLFKNFEFFFTGLVKIGKLPPPK